MCPHCALAGCRRRCLYCSCSCPAVGLGMGSLQRASRLSVTRHSSTCGNLCSKRGLRLSRGSATMLQCVCSHESKKEAAAVVISQGGAWLAVTVAAHPGQRAPVARTAAPSPARHAGAKRCTSRHHSHSAFAAVPCRHRQARLVAQLEGRQCKDWQGSVQSLCNQHNAVAAAFNFYLHARFPLRWLPLFTTHTCAGLPAAAAPAAARWWRQISAARASQRGRLANGRPGSQRYIKYSEQVRQRGSVLADAREQSVPA